METAEPYDVFRRADYFRLQRQKPSYYNLQVWSVDGRAVGPDQGLQLVPNGSYRDAGIPDTLLAVGGFDTPLTPFDKGLVSWITTMRSARRLCSVCSGAFLLAEAGLLNDRKAVCHWGHAELFRERYPHVLLDTNPIFIRDGQIYTSAGATAGMDLALALVEEDLGRAAALEVARSMVLFLKRPGSQSQFSLQLSLQLSDKGPVQELQLWMQDHLAEDLTVPALAKQVRMSPRHFARLFRSTVGLTPARYVEKLRADTARRRLEEAVDPLKIVASEAGFGSVETMRRIFLREFETTPGQYRERFHSSLAPVGKTN